MLDAQSKPPLSLPLKTGATECLSPHTSPRIAFPAEGLTQLVALDVTNTVTLPSRGGVETMTFTIHSFALCTIADD